MSDDGEALFHLCPRVEWENSLGGVGSRGGGLDRADGFLHLSTGTQLGETAALHFAGIRDLVALTIDARALPPGTLKWEVSRGGMLFPHLYALLPVTAVRAVTPLPDDPGSRARRIEALTQFLRR